MSTRSCIARKTSESTFLGVYHHWDGYPSGLGQTLFQAYNGHFKRDLAKMLQFLIDEHQAGWSTICGADFSLPARNYHTTEDSPCAICGLEQWKHYRQYYQHHGMAEFVAKWKNQSDYRVLGHTFEEIKSPKGPEPSSGEPWPIDETEDAGMEWAYVFDEPNRMMYVFERLHNPGAGPGRELFSGKPVEDMSFAHMTGMFGFGAGEENQHWAIAAKIDLDGTEPDWEHISAAEYLLVA